MRLSSRQLIMAGLVVLIGLSTAVAAATGADNLAGAGLAVLATAAVVVLLDVRRRHGELAARLKLISNRLQRTTSHVDKVERTMRSIQADVRNQAPAVSAAVDAAARHLDDVGETLTAGLAMERVGAAERHLEVTQGLSGVAAVEEAVRVQQELLTRVEAAEREALERLSDAVAETRSITQRLDKSSGRDRERFQETKRLFQTTSVALANEIQALMELHHRVDPAATLPSIGGWALEATSLLHVYDLVTRSRPALVVECGSGSSTVWIAYALQQLGSGRVVSLEHDPEFAAQTRAQLEEHGLSAFADVRTAELDDVDIEATTYRWYPLDTVQDLVAIDIVLVDGPPKSVGEYARFPAALLIARLAPTGRVVLDDADRADERAILDRWRAAFPDLADPVPLGSRSVLLENTAGAR